MNVLSLVEIKRNDLLSKVSGLNDGQLVKFQDYSPKRGYYWANYTYYNNHPVYGINYPFIKDSFGCMLVLNHNTGKLKVGKKIIEF